MFKRENFNRAIEKLLNKTAPFPRHAQIEITNLCNLECPMCSRYFIDVEQKHMDYEVFKKVVEKLKGVYLISLCGFGEPLCYPKIFDAIRYCVQNDFRVEITTNGLLLNEECKIRELISTGLNAIRFSLEAIRPESFKEVNGIIHNNADTLDNIKKLVDIRKQLNSDLPQIIIQTLMIKNREQDLFDIIKWGISKGVERISVARFEQFNTLEYIEKPNLLEEKKIFKDFSIFRKKHKIRIDCIQDQVYAGIKGFMYKHFKYFIGMDYSCVRLRDFVYINVNGDVQPCCTLGNCRMGSLLENDLMSIWTSQKYNVFRKNYHKVPWCSRCDFAKLKQITRADIN